MVNEPVRLSRPLYCCELEGPRHAIAMRQGRAEHGFLNVCDLAEPTGTAPISGSVAPIKVKQADVIVACPPCKDFTLKNNCRAERAAQFVVSNLTVSDEDESMSKKAWTGMLKFFVNHPDWRIWVGENVLGIKRKFKKKGDAGFTQSAFSTICEAISTEVDAVVAAADHCPTNQEIPQQRGRVFFCGLSAKYPGSKTHKIELCNAIAKLSRNLGHTKIGLRQEDFLMPGYAKPVRDGLALAQEKGQQLLTQPARKPPTKRRKKTNESNLDDVESVVEPAEPDEIEWKWKCKHAPLWLRAGEQLYDKPLSNPLTKQFGYDKNDWFASLPDRMQDMVLYRHKVSPPVVPRTGVKEQFIDLYTWSN